MPTARTRRGWETFLARSFGSIATVPSRRTIRSSARTSGVNRSIWALGLRNPFTTAFQRSSGRLFINDVGQNTCEEINVGSAGANYGWPATEGVSANPDFTNPIYAYGHVDAACAITGGAFYESDVLAFPAKYYGQYFFADFCAGWIKRLNPQTGTVTSFAAGVVAPVDLKVGPDGALYYLARQVGRVGRISYVTSKSPAIGFNRRVARSRSVSPSRSPSARPEARRSPSSGAATASDRWRDKLELQAGQHSKFRRWIAVRRRGVQRVWHRHQRRRATHSSLSSFPMATLVIRKAVRSCLRVKRTLPPGPPLASLRGIDSAAATSLHWVRKSSASALG